MGAGSSTAGIGDTSAPVPACPLFCNFMPNPLLIPASTLPKRGPDGSLRRPKGGCAARVVPLRGLPIVSEESKRHAKELVADAKNKKRAGNTPACGEEANALAAAAALLSSPSLLPSLSSCFLINIAVDERGRLAPLPTDGGHAAITVAACHGVGASGPGDPSWNVLTSPQSSFVKKGFNFSYPNTPVRTPLVPGADGGRGSSFANDARRLVQGGDNRAVANELGSQLIPTTPASANARGRPPWGAQPKRNSFTEAGLDAGTQPALSKALEKPTSTFAVPLPSGAGPANAVVGTASVGEHDMLSTTTSVCSVLVKDSRFRKPEGGLARANSAAPAYANCGASGGATACLPRMRRQMSRITLLRVPQRTRWFLFNDSKTHEAQVSMLLCYQAQQEKPSGPKRSFAGEKAPVVPPGMTVTTSAPTPGDLRIVCRATPLSHTPPPRRRLKVPLESTYNSNCIYVEVRSVCVEAFTTAIPRPKTPAQERQLAGFKKRVASAAAVEVFVVLAPGATLYLAEGEVLGYRFDVHLVPFDKSGSMAVLGRMLTPALVRCLKEKGKTSNKKGYRHTLIFLAEAAVAPVSTAPAHRPDSAAARLTASAVPVLPKVTAKCALQGGDFIPPILTGTLNDAPLSSMGLTTSTMPPKALTYAAGRAVHRAVAATAVPAPSLQHRLSSSALKFETVGEGEAAAAAASDAGGRRRSSSQRSNGTSGGSGNNENDGTEVIGRFHSCGAPGTASRKAIAALPSRGYSYSYDFADVSAMLESAVVPLAWSAAHATAARADYVESTAGVRQLPVPGLKSLVNDMDEDRSIPRGDARSGGDHSVSTDADPLSVSF
ncbi:hypothetical protein GH5_06034 [Leishmania sp. Ghana 2012 LV757]|uniref:hypothetical protein n=1 Tax=Leishmania sp. Ghana 2012 LV757 TaxID=2803181 RepID=UPI001B79F402|nr:hypothetical protein GH5_06034 [Leishmania sp. Ghana 2012 LV757]